MKNGGKHAKWNCPEEIWAGVAPCECHFEKKLAKMAETQNRNSKISTKNMNFSKTFHPISTILQSCAEALRASQKNLLSKKRQKLAKTPILAPKIVILVNKKCFNQKTSAGTCSCIIIWWPHAKFEENRMVQL